MKNLRFMDSEYLHDERLKRTQRQERLRKLARSGYDVEQQFLEVQTELDELDEEIARRAQIHLGG